MCQLLECLDLLLIWLKVFFLSIYDKAVWDSSATIPTTRYKTLAISSSLDLILY